MLIERDVRQIIVKGAKIVAATDLEVIAHVAVNGGEGAIADRVLATVANIPLVHDPAFEQGVPVLDHVPVEATDREVNVGPEPVVTGAAGRDFTNLHTVLGADVDILRQLENGIRLADQAALTIVRLARASRAPLAQNCLIITRSSPLYQWPNNFY